MRLPQLGMGMTDGDIKRWVVREGDQVEEGGELVEIETMKATTVLEAPVSGTVRKIFCGEGNTLPVGEPLVLIGEPNEPLPEGMGS